MFIRQLTPFWNPTTNYKIRTFILTFLFLAYGKCSNSSSAYITWMLEIWGDAGDLFTK